MSAAAPQTFVEKAQQAAAAAPILPGDDQALALLQDARQHIYHWPARFAGFQARLRVADQHWTLIAPNSRSFRIEPQLEKTDELFGWTHYHLGEILSHREHPKVHQMASKTGVLWGDWDDTYGRRLDFAGDKMSSFYRIKDQRIQQISRRYGGQHFLICIDRHHRFAGRWAAANYVAYYWDAQGELAKVESYHDDFVRIGGVWLPSLRRFTVVEGNQTRHRSLELSEHQLLTVQKRSSHATH